MIRAALTLLLAGCAFAPEDAQPFTPPAVYRAVWDSAQACTGRRGDFGQLRFFLVPGPYFDGPKGEPDAGYTVGHDIYLAEAYLMHPMVVKHEMIHALGVHKHPTRPFDEPCHARWESYEGHGSLE